MKTSILYFIAVFALVVGCKKDKDEPIKEVPEEIIRTETCPTLYSRIEELLPDKNKAENLFPFLFSDTVQREIVLTEESEVYATFVAEMANYKNTLGWYSYPLGNKPTSIDNVNIHVLFPNVSAKGEGGELEKGFMLQLGEHKFPKGTVIGFFLIVRGWNNGTINYSGTTHFTDVTINANSNQQHVMFKERNCGDIVIGFEDMPLSDIRVDKDYNDILITVSDNKEGYESISFDINKLPKL